MAIFVASLTFAQAQSSSASYQAVDFLNAESSLSTSTSYALNDSIDYYGGVSGSSTYKECTGDFAVLGACGGAVTPPPPPPPPPPPTPTPTGGGTIGAGGPYPTHQDCNTIECQVNAPVVQPKPVVKKPFKLPAIKEPVTEVLAPSAPEVVPSEETNEPRNMVEALEKAKTAATGIGAKVIKSVVPVLCEDNTCSEVNLFGSALEKKNIPAAMVCSIYTFGGFEITMSCQDMTLVWLFITIMLVSPFPAGIFYWQAWSWRRRVKARAAAGKKSR